MFNLHALTNVASCPGKKAYLQPTGAGGTNLLQFFDSIIYNNNLILLLNSIMLAFLLIMTQLAPVGLIVLTH